MEKYATLKNQYPDFLSLDHLYRICKISKKSARYLIEHEIIPAIDTGKQTWRYKIHIDDVIEYLERRDEYGSMIPTGAATSRNKNRINGGTGNRISFAQIIMKGEEYKIAEYFSFIYAEYAEVLTTADITEMTGLDKSTVLKLLQSGKIKSVEDKPKYLVPKQYLLEFVVTRRFIEAKTRTETFKKLLGGYEIWKTAKSSR